MNSKEPKFRCGTAKARNSLIAKFNLPHEDWMQDWPYEVSEPEKIDQYFKYYDQVTDEDEKFYLMELLIQATDEQTEILKFNQYWLEVKTRLTKNFPIHEYTVHYWSSFENENLEDSWNITPYMRELWFKQNYTQRQNKLNSSDLAKIIIEGLDNYDLLAKDKRDEAQKTVEEIIELRKSLNDY